MSGEPLRKSAVEACRHGDVMVLTIDNPPVNALAHAVRTALLDAVVTAEEDVGIRAIVIRGAGKHFVGGADIREFDSKPRAPLLNDVLLRIESCTKPVIAAIHGAALGGGLELALACHFRLAAADATIGFPEICLGLLPGSGGTQRLPRLIGVRESLQFILSGESIPSVRAAALGIVDRRSSAPDLSSEALAYARELLAAGTPPRRLRDASAPGDRPDESYVREQAARGSRKYPGVDSTAAIIECVGAAADLPFDEGLALSRRRFEECRQSDSSRALRHLFFAERSSAAEVAPRRVQSVGVLGAGTMGSGIAISLAMAGYPVTMVDTDAVALAAGLARLSTTLNASVEKGRIDRDTAAEARDRVRGDHGVSSLGSVDFVIEAVFENLGVKSNVFATLGRVCRPEAILASNTSTLDIDAIADASGRPENVIGMHFFSPAHIMRLVEIVRGHATPADVIATTLDVSRRMGKLGVVVGNCFGFVGNRMLYAYGRENQLLMLEGATPARIDAAMEGFGMAMGPNAVGDLAGLDVGYRVRRERTGVADDQRYYRVADLLVEAGRLGQKSGRGAFLYPEGTRRPVRDLEVEAMIVEEARRLGIERRAIGDVEIQERCLFALINEGMKIIAEGITRSPADIDAIWCNGYGFPRFRGGPMYYAENIGLETVLEGIQRLREAYGPRYWAAAPLLVELVDRNESLDAWHRRRTAR
ncbi:MAG: 3-hydroxyacyl-CoA dehydrogenase [Gammaproteobacteria bacterium]|nr:3-hydroxyacyl-CoA dehydrogenase [Gammaproteobacteria bacterium]